MRFDPVAVAAVLVLGCAPADASATPVACAADPLGAFNKFIAAFNALDWESFRGCLADSVSLFNPDIPDAISLHRLDGRAAVERNFRAVFDAAAAGPEPRGPDIHPEHVALQRFSDAALVVFEYRRSEHSFGRRSIVLARQGGDWRVLHIHASNVDTQK